MNVYEKEIEYLKAQLIRFNNNSKKFSLDPSFIQWYLANKIFHENEKKQILAEKLQQDFLRIQKLTTEANELLNEMQLDIIYNVILQIPITYLKPNERVC